MEPRKKYYGLARAISASPVQLLSLYRSRRWTDRQVDLLFGEKSTFEFLPDAEVDNPVPVYDYLGRYPDFVDQSEREYFLTLAPEAALQEQAWFYVRIPRRITTQTSGLNASYSSAIDFPRAGEKLQLRTPKKQLASTPYVYSEDSDAIMPSDSRRTRIIANAACDVIETDAERRATARVKCRFTFAEHQFQTCIQTVNTNRANVLQVLTTAAQILSAKDFEEFCDEMMEFYS